MEVITEVLTGFSLWVLLLCFTTATSSLPIDSRQAGRMPKGRVCPYLFPKFPALRKMEVFWAIEKLRGWGDEQEVREIDISGYWEGSELEPELSFLGLSTQEGKDLGGGVEMWETKFAEKNSWPSWDLWGICGSGVRELGGRIHCRPRSRSQCQE